MAKAKGAPKQALKQGKGRPSRYNEAYAKQAYEAIAMSGMTDRQLCRLFGVDSSTLTKWRKAHDEFAKACRLGRDAYDTGEVEKSLLQRAKGYKVVEVTREPVPLDDISEELEAFLAVAGESEGDADAEGASVAKGKARRGPTLRITKTVTKHIAPDTGAAKYWLNNRAPERWKDRAEVKLSGEVENKVVLPDSLTGLFGGYGGLLGRGEACGGEASEDALGGEAES